MAFEQALPPVQPVAEPAPWKDRTLWGHADMAMAIGIVIGAIILIGTPAYVVAVIIAGGVDVVTDSDIAMAVVIGASSLVEVVLLIVAIRFTVGKYKVSWAALGLRRPRRGGYWFPVPLFFAAMIVLFSYVAIISVIGIEAKANVSEDLRDSTLRLTMVGLSSLSLAPFMEEVFFRGFLFGGLRGRWGVLGAALGSGLLFAIAHFSEPSSLAVLPAIGMIGVLFAWGYYYTGSLFAPIVTHFVWNLSTFIAIATGVAT